MPYSFYQRCLWRSRKARLQQRISDGDRRAKTVLHLIENPNLFLATVQIGITLVGVFVGAVGGARLASLLAGWLATVPALTPYAETLAIAIVVIGITFVAIVLGELVPKRIARITRSGSLPSSPVR